MNIFAGGKLKSRKPRLAPSKLQEIAAPTDGARVEYTTTYPKLTTATTPAARPSAPSKKLNALTNSTINTQVSRASSQLWPDTIRHHWVCATSSPARHCVARRMAEDKPVRSSIRPVSHTSNKARKTRRAGAKSPAPPSEIPATSAHPIANPPRRGVGSE